MSPVCRPFLDTARYLPTFSGYEEKLNLIIIKKAFLIAEDHFFIPVTFCLMSREYFQKSLYVFVCPEKGT